MRAQAVASLQHVYGISTHQSPLVIFAAFFFIMELWSGFSWREDKNYDGYPFAGPDTLLVPTTWGAMCLIMGIIVITIEKCCCRKKPQEDEEPQEDELDDGGTDTVQYDNPLY